MRGNFKNFSIKSTLNVKYPFNHGYAAALILVNRGYKSYIDDLRKAISI